MTKPFVSLFRQKRNQEERFLRTVGAGKSIFGTSTQVFVTSNNIVLYSIIQYRPTILQ